METLNELLSVENGVWAIVAIVIAREFIQALRDKNGPAWATNGAMDRIVDKFTLMFQRVLREQQSEFIKFPGENRIVLDRVLDEQVKIRERLEWLRNQHLKYDEGWPRMVEHQEEATHHMESVAATLRAIAAELNENAHCPYRPDDRVKIAEEAERKRSIKARTRSTDLKFDRGDKEPL